MRFQRMWINAPSRFQPYHDWHGENVIAVLDSDGHIMTDGKDPNYTTVALLTGDVYSIRINKMYLSNGWNRKSKQNTKD